MSGFFRALQQPEYVHVLINPLPVYGVGLGLIALVVALFLRNRSAHLIALVVIFIGALSAWPAAYFGEKAYDVALSLSDETSGAWLTEHRHRADQWIWCFYALAAAAALAIVLPKKWPKTNLPLVYLTLLLSIVSLAAGLYIAYAGGKVRHREFRNEPPPEQKAES